MDFRNALPAQFACYSETSKIQITMPHLANQGDVVVSIAEKAKKVYEAQLKDRLEAEHRNEFVAIEPVSESYFLGDTFIAAAMAAKNAFPDQKSFVLQIGHEAAFHIGASSL